MYIYTLCMPVLSAFILQYLYSLYICFVCIYFATIFACMPAIHVVAFILQLL